MVDLSLQQLSPFAWDVPHSVWTGCCNVTEVDLSRLPNSAAPHMRQTLALGLDQLTCLTSLTICIQAFTIVRQFVAENEVSEHMYFERKELSGCFYNLTGLKQLTLTSIDGLKLNKEVRLSNALSALTNLDTLTITNCFASWDFAMPSLTALCMTGNLDCQQLLQCAPLMPALAELHLSIPATTADNRQPIRALGALSAVLGQLPSLASLIVSSGRELFEALQGESAGSTISVQHAHRLSHLTNLNLHVGYDSILHPVLLKSLDWIAVLTQLQQLHLCMSNQDSTSSWSALAKLQQLRSLCIKGCNWGFLPQWLSSLTHLTRLDCAGYSFAVSKDICSMQSASPLAGLQQLQHCSLDNIHAVASSAGVLDVTSLTRLTSMQLAGCNLTGNVSCVVPYKMAHLRVLDLSDNRIESLPESISAMVQLTDFVWTTISSAGCQKQCGFCQDSKISAPKATQSPHWGWMVLS